MDILHNLAKEIMLLCKEKGLDNDETFVIGAMANSVDAVNKFGEETALRMAIEVIKICENDFTMISFALQQLFGII